MFDRHAGSDEHLVDADRYVDSDEQVVGIGAWFPAGRRLCSALPGRHGVMHDIVATKATWDEEDPAADADGWGRRSTTETALDDGNGACRVVKTSPSRKVSRVQSIATTAWPSTDPNDPLTGAWVADADGLLWYEQQQMPGDGEPEHIETLRLVTMPLAPLHDEGSFIDGSYKREIVQRRDAWCWSYEDTVGWPRRERPCARRPSDRNGSEPPSTEDDFHGYFTKPAR